MATRKQITFDLDTKALQTYYPKANWHNAYEDIKKHMKNNGFSWQQGSVYVSNQGMTSFDVTSILGELVKKNPWLNVCMRDCRETNIGKEHSKNILFDKNANIPKRSEVQKDDKKTHTMEEWKKKIAERKAEKEKSAVPEANAKIKVKTEKDRSE